MNTEFYRKLVDLYAGHELPISLEEEMETAALSDSELAHEMRSVREMYDILRADTGPEFNEETNQRILLKMYARGIEIEPNAPEPKFLQFPLPMQG